MLDKALELETASAQETRELGGAIASVLRAGDVVSLAGDLGAGKTTLVQGAAATLGVTERVVSPTFTLVREYSGATPVTHLDVYRLERLSEVLDLGFDELLDRDGVMFVEWGDAIEGMLPESHLSVRLLVLDAIGDDERRRVTATPHGAGWKSRAEALAKAVGAWRLT